MRQTGSARGNLIKQALGLVALSSVPTTRYGPGSFVAVKNTAGAVQLMVNTTGTTWKYLNVTSVRPA